MRDAARLASTARPSAPPIMNAVLTMPDASPDSSGATSLIAASSTGLKAMPAPKPSRSMLGQHVDDEAAVDRRAGEQREPERPRSAGRPPSGGLMPKRITSFAETPTESAPMIRFAGRNARPTCERAVAEHELQVERREEEPREHRRGPEHADDVRGREVAQPEEAERHERRATRDSITRKSASSATAQREQAERLRRTSSRPGCR